MTGSLPLDGVRVVDLGQVYAAPYATFLMALAGAEVVKVEPLGGEVLRMREKVADTGADYPFQVLNVNKKSVALNLKDERGAELLRQLADRADVVVENFRPGIMDKLQVGADVLRARNPRLVYAAASGYGRSSPYRDLAAMDPTVQAMSAVIASTGFVDGPPVKAGPAIADFSGGIHLFGAIMLALFRQRATGEGAVVDIAMMDSVLPALLSNLGLLIGTKGAAPERTGNRHGGLAASPYNVYKTSDGHVALIAVTDAQWKSVIKATGQQALGADPRFESMEGRIHHMTELDEYISAWTSGRTTSEAFAALRANGVPCAPVRSLSEVIGDSALEERGLIFRRDLPGFGEVPLFHSPLLFEGEERSGVSSAPRLGADTQHVLRAWLGQSDADLATLARQHVIFLGDEEPISPVEARPRQEA